MAKKLPPLILASASIARVKLLTDLDLKFTIKPSNFDEQMILGKKETHQDLAVRLALGKARDVAKELKSGIVIGADSFAVIGDKMLGKPGSKAKAIKQLSLLSGKTHTFITGMVVIDTATKKEVTDVSTTKVTFRKLSMEEIQRYVDIEDVRVVAGSYRIMHLGNTLIEKIDGDFYAVVGLSLVKLSIMLKKLGFDMFQYII